MSVKFPSSNFPISLRLGQLACKSEILALDLPRRPLPYLILRLVGLDFFCETNSFVQVDGGCHLCWLFCVYLPDDTRTGIKEAKWIEYNVIRPRTNDSPSRDIQALQQMWKSADEGHPLGWSELMHLVPDTGKSRLMS